MAQSADQMYSAIEAEVRAAVEAEIQAKLESARALVGSRLEEQVAVANQRVNDRRAALANDEAELISAQAELDSFRASQVVAEEVQG